VHVDEHVRGPATQLGERGVDLRERRPGGLHEYRAREIDDSEGHPGALDHRYALARAALWIVGGAHDALVAVEELVHLGVPVGVIAERDHVGSGVEDVEGRAFGDADAARGVLAVHDDEVGAVALAQSGHQRG